jgi:signal transduction histidine kinase/CheY-like chemotaxis protein
MNNLGRVDGLEAAWKKRDGTTIYVRESARAVRDESGGILYYEGTVEDITRRRTAEQQLEAEHRRLLSVFDGLDAVIYVCDPATHELLYMNPAATELWDEANGRKCFELLQGRSDPCPFCTNDRIFSAEYDGRSYVWEHQNKVNQRWYRCTDKAIVWPDGRRVRFETAIDITNERRLAEEMTKAEKLESVGVLAGGIAHDFNNLLTGILGNISLARADIGDSDNGYSIGELLEQAEDAAMRARSLTQQLLTFSRGGAPVTAVTSIQSLLKECSEFVLAGTGARCRFDLTDDLGLVEVDEGQLSQVVANLVLNADQAMSGGGEVLISARNVSLESDNRLPLPAGHYVRISVRDRGVGIPPENIGRIFDPFFTTREFGRGLGLTTSFTIVRKHGGHLGVESQPGHGSTFHVYLPVSTTETEVAPRRAVTPPRGTGNILVVDDEEAVRNVAEITLTKLGYQVTATASGEEAVEVLRQVNAHGGSFDVTVVDLTMPGGIDGVETFRRMRAIDPTLCGIVSSGYANSSVMSSYRDYGFSAAIDKPYTFTRLADAVQSALRETPAGGSSGS